MVKRGGIKRKIPMEKITNKEARAVAFTKRSYGLFSKASQLCLLSGGQIAVLASPPSSNSNVSFYSFGHSSVDSVVSAFLAGKRLVPVIREETREEDVGVILARKDLGLGQWWEDDDVLAKLKNPQELTDAMNSMSTLLRKLKELCTGEAVGSYPNSDQTLIRQSDNEKSEPDQTLIPHSDNEKSEPDQTLTLQSDTEESNNNNNNDKALNGSLDVGYDQEMDIDQFIDFDIDQFTDFDTSVFDDCLLESTQEDTTGSLLINSDLPETESFNEITEEQSQILAICESFCDTEENNDKALTGSLDVGYDQEMDIDQFIDFNTNFDASAFDDFLLETTQEETTASPLINSDDVWTTPNPISVYQGFEDKSCFSGF